MSKQPDPDDGKRTGPVRTRDLDKRIAAAKERQHGGSRAKRGSVTTSGIGFGLRLASELIAALGVGVAIGIGLDRWLGTMPLFLIVFFVLGAAAALMNVIRLANAYEKRHAAGGAGDETGGDAAHGAASAGRPTGDDEASTGDPPGAARGSDEGRDQEG